LINVEEAFINTAKKIYEKILKGAFDVVRNLCGFGVEEKEYNCPPGPFPFFYFSLTDCERRKYLVILTMVEIIILNILMAANWLGTLFALILSAKVYIGSFILACIYMIFVPCCLSFFVLFWSTYKAALTANVFRFGVAIVIWVLGIIWMLFLILGSPASGSGGLWSGIQILINPAAYTSQGFAVFTGIYHLAMAGLFSLNILIMLAIIGLSVFHIAKDGKKDFPKKVEEEKDPISSAVDSAKTQVAGQVVKSALGF